MNVKVIKGKKEFTNVWTIHLKQNSTVADHQVVYSDGEGGVFCDTFPDEVRLIINGKELNPKPKNTVRDYPKSMTGRD